jgi:lipopolysaccharide export LptBFGC system permease protein LptF
MESSRDTFLFRRYWRAFLPVWLLPVPILAAVLILDFGSDALAARILPYIIVAIILYLVVAQLRAIGFFRRGELTYWQIWVLSTPMALVAVTCILLRAFVLAFFGHDHATI